MKLKRLLFFLYSLFFVFTSFSICAIADESESGMPSEYSNFLDSLPDEVIDSLPGDMLSNDPLSVGDGISDFSRPDNMLKLALDGLLGGVREIYPTLVLAIGIMIISFVASSVTEGMGHNRLAVFISHMSLLCVILGLVYNSITLVSGYFESLCKMAAAYLPLSAVLYSIGGNISTAASSSATFGVCLTVCQFIFTYTAVPVFVFSLSMAVTSSFYESKTVSSISSAVKKYYTMLLSLVMSVMSVSLGAQNVISSKMDNATMRGAKFIFSSFVPVTGGTISSSMGAIASSVELIRGCVGIGGIIIIFIMLAPLVCHLVGMKLFLFILEIFSDITGGGSMISQISSLYSYLLGVALISSTVFILSFALLASCASAIA